MDFNIDKIKDRIQNVSKTTKIYLGCDSEIRKNPKTDELFISYSTVVVLHIDGHKGCEIYGKVETDNNLDYNLDKPILRLMGEVYRVTELYMELQDVLKDRDVQIHLDINPNENAGSNIAYQQAVGYVKGVCKITPVVKPDAFASSKCADRFSGLK